MYGVVWRGDYGIETEPSLKTIEGKPVYYPAIVMRNTPPPPPPLITLLPCQHLCPLYPSPPLPALNPSLAEFCSNGDLLSAVRPAPEKAPAGWQQRLVYASHIASGTVTEPDHDNCLCRITVHDNASSPLLLSHAHTCSCFKVQQASLGCMLASLRYCTWISSP